MTKTQETKARRKAYELQLQQKHLAELEKKIEWLADHLRKYRAAAATTRAQIANLKA